MAPQLVAALAVKVIMVVPDTVLHRVLAAAAVALQQQEPMAALQVMAVTVLLTLLTAALLIMPAVEAELEVTLVHQVSEV
jgi:hypothetical protein